MSHLTGCLHYLNMDTQDEQDKEDETLLHRKRTRSMIGCSFEVIHDHGNRFCNPC